MKYRNFLFEGKGNFENFSFPFTLLRVVQKIKKLDNTGHTSSSRFLIIQSSSDILYKFCCFFFFFFK